MSDSRRGKLTRPRGRGSTLTARLGATPVRTPTPLKRTLARTSRISVTSCLLLFDLEVGSRVLNPFVPPSLKEVHHPLILAGERRGCQRGRSPRARGGRFRRMPQLMVPLAVLVRQAWRHQGAATCLRPWRGLPMHRSKSEYLHSQLLWSPTLYHKRR